MTRKTYVQHPDTGKLVLKEDYHREERGVPAVHGLLEPFKSPIDGTVIDDRAKLRAHNKRHGVTDSRDYGQDWYARKENERHREITGQNDRARGERIEVIKHTLDKFRR